MVLFIARLPLHCWVDNPRTPPAPYWSVRLPGLLSPVSGYPLSTKSLQLWVIDTGFTGQAFAWRHHLEDAGLDPDTDRDTPIFLQWSVSTKGVQAPVRRTDLWLASNIPHLTPFLLPLWPGVAFRNQRVVIPDPEFHRALLGMRLLIRAGVKLEVDFASRTVSLWTP